MGDPTEEVRSPWSKAVRSLDEVEAAAWHEAARGGRLDLFERIAVTCAGQLGLRPLTPPAGFGPDRGAGQGAPPVLSADDLIESDGTILEFAVQFGLDVAAVTDEQRSTVLRLLGDQVAAVTAVIFVMDFLPRARAALRALGGDCLGLGREDGQTGREDQPIWDALGRLVRIVPRLDALDPVTTELIRLRGARQHQCRLCKSLRSRPALLAGADESTFSEVDTYETSPLPPFQKAALAFTDAMIWTPGRLEASAPRLRELASVEQCVEVVLDVTRNALNKIAVALGADAAHVDEGIEIYDIDADGELLYGLTLG